MHERNRVIFPLMKGNVSPLQINAFLLKQGAGGRRPRGQRDPALLPPGSGEILHRTPKTTPGWAGAPLPCASVSPLISWVGPRRSAGSSRTRSWERSLFGKRKIRPRIHHDFLIPLDLSLKLPGGFRSQLLRSGSALPKPGKSPISTALSPF